jgi:hypothetical protein
MTQSTLPPKTPVQADEAPVLYCANHPTVETLLRCNKCGKPICMKCAVQTPVGYRCRECVRQQQDVYYNAERWDNLIAFVVAFIVTVIATPIVALLFGMVPFFFSFLIALAVGASAGGLLAQIIRWAVKRRRGRYLGYSALAGIILGVLLGALGPGLLVGVLALPSIGMWIFAFLAITTAYRILR